MSFSAKWAALAVALASIAFLVGPASASAVVTPTVQNNKLTVTSDGQADEIKLTVVEVQNIKKIAVNGTATTLTADANAEIVVEAGDGNDMVEAKDLIAGTYKENGLLVNGGEGDDEIVGGAVNGDKLNGDAGNDKITGGKGSDTVKGGIGDDTMIWNNGDGSDTNEGEGGIDTVESNGNNDPAVLETYTYEGTTVGGEERVLFERTSAIAFHIDFTAEKLLVNSLAGNDSFQQVGAESLATRTQITINAGEGTDVIVGSDGNDTVIAGKGDDFVFGEEGDDVMIWNNGDGNDENTGGADLDGQDIDETVINGNPTAEAFSYSVGKPGWVRLDRAANGEGKGAFFVESIETEKFVINSAAGDDHLEATEAGLAGLTQIIVNAGDGNDTVGGGDGADTLNGDAGNDMLVGGNAAVPVAIPDIVSGGTGDDVMVWNNGDGSDENIGGEGLDVSEINGNPNAEAFTYGPAQRPGWVRLDRAANSQGQGAFFVESIATEKLVVNGAAGDDSFGATAAGLAELTQVTVNAGEGDDTVHGGDGGDILNGGNGSDVLDGKDGDDQLMARDQQNDLVRGGAGEDSAQTDELTIDSVSGVEKLDAIQPPAPPVPDTVAELPTLGKTTVAKSGKKLVAKVPVSCPAAETGGCRTTLTLETAKAARLGSLRAIVVLGSTTVNLGPGARMTASIRIANGASALARRGKLPARIRIASTDAAGNTAIRTAAVTLRVPHL